MNFGTIKDKRVFRRDNEYGSFYSIGMSRKLEDGTYENGYIDVRFKKDVELDNMTKINILDSFLTFYLKNEGDYKVTKPYIFIREFEIVEDETETETDEQVEIEFTDDLPF